MMFDRNHKNSWFDGLVIMVLLLAILPALSAKNAVQHRHSWLPRSVWAWAVILAVFTLAVAGYHHFRTPVEPQPVKQEQSI